MSNFSVWHCRPCWMCWKSSTHLFLGLLQRRVTRRALRTWEPNLKFSGSRWERLEVNLDGCYTAQFLPLPWELCLLEFLCWAFQRRTSSAIAPELVFPKMLPSQLCPGSETESLPRTGARTRVGAEAAEGPLWPLETSCQLSARRMQNVVSYWLCLLLLLGVESLVNYLRKAVVENQSGGIPVFQSVRQNMCICSWHTNPYREVNFFF